MHGLRALGHLRLGARGDVHLRDCLGDSAEVGVLLHVGDGPVANDGAVLEDNDVVEAYG